MIDKKVIEVFRSVPEVMSVWRDQKSEETGRRGNRYTVVLARPLSMQAMMDLTAPLLIEDPDFAWNAYEAFKDDIDDFPRTCIWSAAAGSPDDVLIRPAPPKGAGPELIPVQQLARRWFWQVPSVVGVTSTPDIVQSGGSVAISVVIRRPMGALPMDDIRALEQRTAEFKAAHPHVRVTELQICPELNFPPLGAHEDSDDPWLELKGEIMRRVEPFRMVEAVWWREPATLLVETADGRPAYDGPPKVYVLGEDDKRLWAELMSVGVVPVHVSALESVPRDAACIFNDITRLMVAQAKGDVGTVNRIREKISAAAARQGATGAKTFSSRNLVLDEFPPMDRNDPTTFYTSCRWCDAKIPASANPNFRLTCGRCGAFTQATTIPTKNTEMPILSIWLNPDNTAYFEFVMKPPIEGRWDLSKVVRLTIQGEPFEQHPLGRKR